MTTTERIDNIVCALSAISSSWPIIGDRNDIVEIDEIVFKTLAMLGSRPDEIDAVTFSHECLNEIDKIAAQYGESRHAWTKERQAEEGIASLLWYARMQAEEILNCAKNSLEGDINNEI